MPSIEITPTSTRPASSHNASTAREQLAQRPLVPAAELRDRRVIRHPHRRDQLVGHVLPARPLDPPRGPVPARVRVQQQRHHHRRLIRRAPLTVLPIRPIERAQIHLIDRPQDRPHHMIIRHPIRQIRRQQHRLPPVTSNEVLSHPGMVLNPPGRHTFARQPRRRAGRLDADRRGTRFADHAQLWSRANRAVASVPRARASGRARTLLLVGTERGCWYAGAACRESPDGEGGPAVEHTVAAGGNSPAGASI